MSARCVRVRTCLLVGTLFVTAALSGAAVFDVRAFGAKGDAKTLDRDAINRAIEAASQAGGGVVTFGAGTYLTGSIHLRSHVELRLEPGATLEATADKSAYDEPEPSAWTRFQDFGHSHFHNSLIWGEGLVDIAITGTGRIVGTGLTREEGSPNKAIALKNCRGVTLRDFTVLLGGHFALLATGTDDLTIDNLRIDTNRDGLDIDSSRNVRITNCVINSPNDDAIVLKASHALGVARATEQVVIANCIVSGYDVGTMLDGTYKRTLTKAPDRDGPTGRIKLGTESEGDFRNITITNCVFDRSRGLAIESVDGAHIEDIAVSNITMRDVSNAPIFIRLGARMRAPEGVPVGSIRRVHIANVIASGVDARYPATISGIPGHDVEDVTLTNVRLVSRGGLTLDDVAKQRADLVNGFFYRTSGGVPPREPYATPEREREYPEPAMFGLLPASALFIRHARGIEVRDWNVSYSSADTRPHIVVDQSSDVRIDGFRVAAPHYVILQSKGVSFTDAGMKDTRVDQADKRELH